MDKKHVQTVHRIETVKTFQNLNGTTGKEMQMTSLDLQLKQLK
jgi:hypothetical protein